MSTPNPLDDEDLVAPSVMPPLPQVQAETYKSFSIPDDMKKKLQQLGINPDDLQAELDKQINRAVFGSDHEGNPFLKDSDAFRQKHHNALVSGNQSEIQECERYLKTHKTLLNQVKNEITRMIKMPTPENIESLRAITDARQREKLVGEVSRIQNEYKITLTDTLRPEPGKSPYHRLAQLLEDRLSKYETLATNSDFTNTDDVKKCYEFYCENIAPFIEVIKNQNINDATLKSLVEIGEKIKGGFEKMQDKIPDEINQELERQKIETGNIRYTLAYEQLANERDFTRQARINETNILQSRNLCIVLTVLAKMEPELSKHFPGKSLPEIAEISKQHKLESEGIVANFARQIEKTQGIAMANNILKQAKEAHSQSKDQKQYRKDTPEWKEQRIKAKNLFETLISIKSDDPKVVEKQKEAIQYLRTHHKFTRSIGLGKSVVEAEKRLNITPGFSLREVIGKGITSKSPEEKNQNRIKMR